MPNTQLAYRVLDLIEAHPEHWNQRRWHCGTSHCFAGFVECLVLGANPFNSWSAELTRSEVKENFKKQWEGTRLSQFSQFYLDITNEVAIKELGIDKGQASQLFDAKNTLEDLHQLVSEIFGPRVVKAKVKQLEGVKVSC